ncbi:unnamed protein product, partial [Candidula unifasciata]
HPSSVSFMPCKVLRLAVFRDSSNFRISGSQRLREAMYGNLLIKGPPNLQAQDSCAAPHKNPFSPPPSPTKGDPICPKRLKSWKMALRYSYVQKCNKTPSNVFCFFLNLIFFYAHLFPYFGFKLMLNCKQISCAFKWLLFWQLCERRISFTEICHRERRQN